jgi:hypothetical protein
MDGSLDLQEQLAIKVFKLAELIAADLRQRGVPEAEIQKALGRHPASGVLAQERAAESMD